jgi:hypothetical protein
LLKNQTDEFLKSWGSLYPRSGFLNQKNEVKTASVIAARALEVVSDGGARIYQSSGCTSAALAAITDAVLTSFF